MAALEILTPRFILRSLIVDDVSSNYCRWMNSATDLKYIEATKSKHDESFLRAYISERVNRDDVLFLGIYENENHEHIGNIKYEPVNINEGYAVMGILIGEKNWWGQGVAAEVIKHSAKWLNQSYGISEIILGVDLENEAAIRAYKKVGFQKESTTKITVGSRTMTMILHLEHACL